MHGDGATLARYRGPCIGRVARFVDNGYDVAGFDTVVLRGGGQDVTRDCGADGAQVRGALISEFVQGRCVAYFIGCVVGKEPVPVCVGERCTVVSDEVGDDGGLEENLLCVLRLGRRFSCEAVCSGH